MTIREMLSSDGDAVVDIYDRALKSGHASFQQNGGSWDDWDHGHLTKCRYVAVDEAGQVTGWAGLSAVSGRCAFAGVAEVSVYVDRKIPAVLPFIENTGSRFFASVADLAGWDMARCRGSGAMCCCLNGAAMLSGSTRYQSNHLSLGCVKTRRRSGNCGADALSSRGTRDKCRE